MLLIGVGLSREARAFCPNSDCDGDGVANHLDLWPGIRLKGKTTPTFQILSPNNDTVFKNTLQCEPFPGVSPNRIRCHLPQGDKVGNESVCQDNWFEGLLLPTNPRMIPSCSTNVGGALIEVYWK